MHRPKPCSALAQGLLRCHTCGHLSPLILNHQPCPRCAALLHPRIPNSLSKTFALICSALILYIPANLFPIMIVRKFGAPEEHTILSGIIALMNSGMQPIAILVFIASILVPLIKILGLIILLLAVKYRWQKRLALLTKIYRWISFVGRWSMLDIFIISILVSIVSSEALEQVIAGPAASAFAAVVVLTMLATNNFDPRLLWDSVVERNN